MQVIRIYYISLSGNTTNFLERLDHYLQRELQEKLDYVNVKDLVKNNESLEFEIKEPYFAFLPAYLEGGNGVTTGNIEILTTPLRRLIAYKKNSKYCMGIIGSGNRNFNKQFCLTAHQYSEEFGFPVLDEFELRGTEEDVIRISNRLNTRLIEWRYSSELVSYRHLPNLTSHHMPHPLRHSHHIKDGTWEKITIWSGKIKIFELRENGDVLRECTYDTSNQPPFIEPQTWYKLSPLTEDLVFSIDLFCKKSDFLHQ